MNVLIGWLIIILIGAVEILLALKYRNLLKVFFKHFLLKSKGGKFTIEFLPGKTVNFDVLTPDKNGQVHLKMQNGEEQITVVPDDVFWLNTIEGQVIIIKSGEQFTINPYKTKSRQPDPRIAQLAIMEAEALGMKEREKQEKWKDILIMVGAVAAVIAAAEGFMALQTINQLTTVHVVQGAKHLAGKPL